MKLRTKITAAAVSLLLFFSAAFSLWNLSLMQTSILRVLIKSEWQQLNTDAKNFSAGFLLSSHLTPGIFRPPAVFFKKASVKMPFFTVLAKSCTIPLPIPLISPMHVRFPNV